MLRHSVLPVFCCLLAAINISKKELKINAASRLAPTITGLPGNLAFLSGSAYIIAVSIQ